MVPFTSSVSVSGYLCLSLPVSVRLTVSVTPSLSLCPPPPSLSLFASTSLARTRLHSFPQKVTPHVPLATLLKDTWYECFVCFPKMARYAAYGVPSALSAAAARSEVAAR